MIQQLRQEGLWAKKGLGQNFLVDENALGKIVEAAELTDEDTVLEIGPGLGVLTTELVQRVKKVVAVELDEKLAERLKAKDELAKNNLEVVQGDALDFDPSIFHLEPNTYKLVANIPYYITGKIIEKFLTAENRPSLIVLLVQKEVAERICAKPGQMSVLAFSVQLYGEPEIVGIVPASSFFPAPKVDSAILKIRITEKEERITNEKELFKYVKMGFGAKRRTLVNNLSGGLHIPRENIEKVLKDLNTNPMARAQELSVAQWKELIKKLDR